MDTATDSAIFNQPIINPIMETPANVTILLVDDKPANTFALEELLAQEGRTLLVANSGRDALKMALDKAIDLIILDVHMPDMDGFEVAKTLRSNKKTRDIPIIFATAEKKEYQSMLKGFDEGAIDYMFKPLDPEITKAKVSVLLKLQLQKKELVEKNKALEEADKQIRRLNRDLQKNIAQLETLNKELESFSYSVSHDLKAPLRALDSYSRIMEEEHVGKLDDEGKRILHIIGENAKKMGAMVDNLLEFSRLGRKEITKVDVNMEFLVKRCIDEVNNTVKHNADIQIGSLLPAKGDYDLLAHVWTNLISNAIKYSGKKEKPQVEIGSESRDGKTTYYVKDNGAGFDMAYADRLFGVFQRLHSQQDFNGIGIGLAIVQRIIVKHGGNVWAEGKPNQGASFYFSLPEEKING